MRAPFVVPFFRFGTSYEMRCETTQQMDSVSDYKAVLASVSRVTGIPETFIFSHRMGQIYRDARWIAVRLLADLGYYSTQIADFTGLSSRHVNRILDTIRGRNPSTWRLFGRELDACRSALGLHENP